MGLWDIGQIDALSARRPRSTDRDATHVGADRRATPAPDPGAHPGVLLATVVSLVALWGLLETAKVLDREVLVDLDRSVAATLCNTAALALAGVVAFLAFMRGRLSGTAKPVYVGTAVVFLGVFAVAVAQLLPQLSAAADEGAFLAVFEPSALLVAALVLAGGALSPEVDTRITPLRLVGAALAVTGLVAVALYLAGPVGDVMTSRPGDIVVALAWAGVAAVHLVAGRRRVSRPHLVVAAAASILMLAALTHAVGAASPPTTAATATFFTLFALLILLGQGLRDHERSFCEQRARLLDTEITVETVNTLRRAEHEAQEERVHDARSALLAIEAAATMLERHRDQLDPTARSQIGAAVSAEVARLQDLISNDSRSVERAPFSLAELLTPLVTTERARGAHVEMHVPGDLVAVGRGADTAEVFRNLFDNARRYAPGSPVTISGEVDREWVVVHVDDHGSGVERSEREAIFGRGDRGSSSAGTDGSGLGLYVSRRLLRDQGGDLWVEPRPGGGARFAFCLPRGTSGWDPDDDLHPHRGADRGVHSGDADG